MKPRLPLIVAAFLLPLFSQLQAQIEISSIEELQLIGSGPDYPLDGDYVLTQNIDASATEGWNDGAGFAPIGDSDDPFTGVFDGQGHVISGLFINRPDEDGVGLFGSIRPPGLGVRDLTLLGGDVTGGDTVGMLAGVGGSARGVHATGSVAGGNTVGGVFGFMSHTLSESNARVHVSGNESVGGLVGAVHTGTVSASYATGTVRAEHSVGGLVGWAYGGATVINSHATGPVYAADSNAGGLVGTLFNHSRVEKSYATGSVSGGGRVGGLVGFSALNSFVWESYATGSVSGASGSLGGLVGHSTGGPGGGTGNVVDSYWDFQTTGQAESANVDDDDEYGRRTTAQMTYPYHANTYAEWDFGETWAEDHDYSLNGGYPVLRATAPSWTFSLLEPEGQGATDPSPGKYVLVINETAEVSAQPEPGWALDRWILDGQDAGDDNPIAVEPLDPGVERTLQAVFVPLEGDWTLSILPPEGHATMIPETGDHQYPLGEHVTVHADRNSGWALDHWLLDGEEADVDTIWITVLSPYAPGETRTVQAVLEPVRGLWTLSIQSPEGEGTTQPGPGEHQFAVGEHATVEAHPEHLWFLDQWVLDGEVTGESGNTFRVLSPGEAGETRTLQAVFAPAEETWFLHILEPEGEGTTDPAPGEYEHALGDVAAVASVPAEGWALYGWLLDGEERDWWFDPINVRADEAGQTRTLQAIFAPLPEGVIYVSYIATGENDGTSWEDAFTELQDALDAAEPGNEIWVYHGAGGGPYTPTHDHGLGIGERGKHFRLKNGVSVYGGFHGHARFRDERNPDAGTILSGDINGANVYHVFYHPGAPEGEELDETAVLDGFRIVDGRADGEGPHAYGGGMHNVRSSPTLVNVLFEKNSAGGGGGMYNEESSPSLTNCRFGRFDSNTAEQGGGMLNVHGSAPSLVNCLFVSNSADEYGGGMLNEDSSPALTDCIFSGNTAEQGGGMHNLLGSAPSLEDCLFEHNEAEIAGGGMYNDASSPSLVEVLFQENAASVGAGMANYEGSAPVLDACMFEGNVAENAGGGMYNDGASPVLTGTSFLNNGSPVGGGMMNSSGSAPALDDCLFEDNIADVEGGGMNNVDSSPTIAHCVFQFNGALQRGGAMHNDVSSPTVSDSLFRRNWADEDGGGMFNAESSPTVRNCSFVGNGAPSGGGMLNYQSSPEVANSEFAWNEAWEGDGGGMLNWQASSPEVVNCTFGGGHYAERGAAMANLEGSSPFVANTIMHGSLDWGADEEVFNDATSQPSFRHSNVAGSGGSGAGWDPSVGTDGGGNIDADPLFVDPGDPNLRLLEGSPSIDAGDNDALPGDLETDLDGNPRVAGNAVDMGAYEHPRAADPLPLRERFNQTMADAGLTGEDAEPDAAPFGEGVENLQKYAFNMDLTGPDNRRLVVGAGGTAGLPGMELDDSGDEPALVIEFLRRRDSDLVYTLMFSSNLDNWTAAGGETVEQIDDEWERVTVTQPAEPGNEDRLFGRIEVAIP